METQQLSEIIRTLNNTAVQLIELSQTLNQLKKRIAKDIKDKSKQGGWEAIKQ